MMAVLNLHGRKNFPDNCLTPAVAEGFVKLLHPDGPRPPAPKIPLDGEGPDIHQGCSLIQAPARHEPFKSAGLNKSDLVLY